MVLRCSASQGTWQTSRPNRLVSTLKVNPAGLAAAPWVVEAKGHPICQANAWHSLGYSHHRLGDYHPALTCYRQALGRFRQAGDDHLTGLILTDLGDTHSCSGDTAAAGEAWREALALPLYPVRGVVAGRLGDRPTLAPARPDPTGPWTQRPGQTRIMVYDDHTAIRGEGQALRGGRQRRPYP